MDSCATTASEVSLNRGVFRQSYQSLPMADKHSFPRPPNFPLYLHLQADEPVPGCSGSPETGVDYCVKREYVMPDTEDDETDPPTKAPVTSNHNNSVMPEKDVGDAEEETSGSVVNMAQDAPTQAPTFEFRGPPSSAAPTSTYYSMMLQNFSEPQPLQFVGNDGDFDAYPLGPCQGGKIYY